MPNNTIGGFCPCGCGAILSVGQTYVPGHDQKHLSNVLREVTGERTRPEQCRVLEDMRDDLRTARACIFELNRYLRTEKFHVDPTVQVNDVLTRLSDAWVALCTYTEDTADA